MIVFFLPDMKVGGAERVMLNLLLKYHNEYPESSIALLLGKKQGPLLAFVPETIPVFSLNASSGLRSFFPYLKFCREHNPSVVFSSLGSSVTSSLGKLVMKVKPFVINRLGNTIGAEKMLYKNFIKRRGYILANQLIGKLSDHLIFQSFYMEKDFFRETEIEACNTTTIYNPVKIESIERLAEEPINKKYDFVAVGRLSSQKNYSNLLRACSILKNRKIKFSLAILGEGNSRKELEKEITLLDLSEMVFLLGQVSNPYPYILNAKYLVSSSLYEGFSNVIVEALSLGVPVIATDCPGGNAEVIIDNFNGFLCENNNSMALANLMATGLRSFQNFQREEIVSWSKKRFAEDVIFEQYNRVFQKYI